MSRTGNKTTRTFKIERAAGLSTNMLFFAVHHGGYSIYPTDLAPIAPKLDDDLLARLVDGTHRRWAVRGQTRFSYLVVFSAWRTRATSLQALPELLYLFADFA